MEQKILDMEQNKTVIRVRRGREGGARYCACDNDGNPIRGFSKLSEIRRHWKLEIRWGQVELVRELDKTPDMTAVNNTLASIRKILAGYGRKGNTAGGQ